MTCFDDLSTYLLCKIFDYLSFTDLFQAFFALQHRLNSTIRNYPACIDLSTVIDRNLLQDYSFRCRSLIVSGSDLEQLQKNYSHLNFASLRAVTFKKTNLITLQSLIEQLPMQQLESITIGRLTWQYHPTDMYERVWSTVMASVGGARLRYLYLPYNIHHWDFKQLSFDLSVLEDVTLEFVSVNQMLAFMRHTPNLRRFKACLANSHKDVCQCDVILRKLRHLTLNLQDEWSFEQLHQLLAICPQLKQLSLKLQTRKDAIIMFEPTAWETLIEFCLPLLVYLQLQLSYIIVYPDTDQHDLQTSFDHANYWLQRRPHFQVTVYKIQEGFPHNIY